MRQSSVKILAGDNSTETIHKEWCLFKLEISKIMWSKGNTTEKMRIANLVQNNEVILDMLVGIGYFSIPIACHANPKNIFIEINPESFHYLNENININKLNEKSNKKVGHDLMKSILGDSKIIAPKINADRILMGYVKTTHKFLDSAIKTLNKEGIFHYYETVPEKLMNNRPINRNVEAPDDR